MECQHPVWIQDPRKADLRDKYGTRLNCIKVPCGKCPSCQSNHRKMWFIRLKYEAEHCMNSYVVTLTYNDSVLPAPILDPNGLEYHKIDYSDVQRFHKRLRKALGTFRFFAIGEYGPEHLRPHYHICYFFHDYMPLDRFENEVFKQWFPDCRITVDTTNDKAANYILKYCLKPVDEDIPDWIRPVLRCSTKPYIGAGLVNERNLSYFLDRKTDITNYVGYRQRLPRIYRDKFFDDDTKKFLSAELERVLTKRFHDNQDIMLEYEKKHGIRPFRGDHERFKQFNLQVNRSVKLRSIK